MMELGFSPQVNRTASIIGSVLLAGAGFALWAARRFRQKRPSVGALTGRIVLYEWQMPAPTVSTTPPLMIRGARDAIERFIPLEEFGPLFQGFAIWNPSAESTDDMPGEALGVWSRRTCSRFRRVLRERGAILDVRREPGPHQRLGQLAKSSMKLSRRKYQKIFRPNRPSQITSRRMISPGSN